MPLPELTWDLIVDARIAHVGNVEEGTRARAAADLARFRTLVGDDLVSLPEWTLRLLFNNADWTQEWIRWFVDACTRIEGVEGWQSLAQRLRSEVRFDEALSVLQVAERLEEVGFNLAVDLPVQIGDKRKEPDLTVTDPVTGTGFRCEVSILTRSDLDRRASEAFSQVGDLMPALQVEGVAVFGKLLKASIARPRMVDIVERIKTAAAAAVDGEGLQEIVVPGIAELAVAREREPAAVVDWCQQRGIEPWSLSGVGPAVDEINRIRGKVEREARQLPPGSPNLMVIYANDLFVRAALAEISPAHLLSDLEEVAFDEARMAIFVVGTDDFGDTTPQELACGGHHYSRGKLGGVVRQRLLIRNEYASVAMPPEVEEKVRRAFRFA